MSEPSVVTIVKCSACGMDHQSLIVNRLMPSEGEYTHFAICPIAGKRVLVRFVPDVADAVVPREDADDDGPSIMDAAMVSEIVSELAISDSGTSSAEPRGPAFDSDSGNSFGGDDGSSFGGGGAGSDF